MSLLWQCDRRLAEFSTFGIGGPIRYFAAIHTSEEMEEAFLFVRQNKLPFLLVGKGSNCLFSDDGFDGVVLSNQIDFCLWDQQNVSAGAGYSFSLLGVQAAKKNLSGLEFAAGIPASVGGAVFMNAGAHGQETGAVVASVVYLESSGKKIVWQKSDLTFRYRYSSFQEKSGAILSAQFSLCSTEKVREKQLALVTQRMKTQPLQEKSIGCIFRNPAADCSAGALIDRCGLKGYTVGGAEVSRIHANFIVNRNHATAEDVHHLIQLIRETVYAQTGIYLESEVRIVSHDGRAQ